MNGHSRENHSRKFKNDSFTQFRAGDAVQVWGEAPLGFDGGEALHVLPIQRRRLDQSRPQSFEKCNASNAARR
jgi:hypothetical protein